MAADWEAMRLEYAATDISLRELAKKYGVSRQQTERHCKKEGWVHARGQLAGNVRAECEAIVSARQAMDYARVIEVSEQAMALGAEILALLREKAGNYAANPQKYAALITGIDKAEQLFRRTHGLDNQQQTQQIQITITPPEGEELTEQDMGV